MYTCRMRSFAACVLIALAPSLAGHALLKSTSGKIVVLSPKDLPREASLTGDSMFLHQADNGEYYLYIEQQHGSAIAIFDVTDPAHIKLQSTERITADGVFDFVRPMGEGAELIRFREGKRTAVLDLSKKDKPTLHDAPALKESQATVVTDETDSANTAAASEAVPEIAKDYDVVDTSSPDKAEHVITVQQVKQQVVNDETGTTFLLAPNGLTVVRRPDAEETYATQQAQKSH